MNGDNPYLEVLPVNQNGPGPASKSPRYMLRDTLNRYGKKMEDATRKTSILADNFWHHLKFSPSVTNAAMARLVQGTKVFITEGGQDKVFQQTFGSLPGEKLVKAHACYLSTLTSSGPVIGMLYVTTKRVTFCSDYPYCQNSSLQEQKQRQRVYYKVVMEIDQLRSVNPSANKLNPSEKYIQIMTKDGHEFWFLGFISYENALKHLSEALQHAHREIQEIQVS